MIKQKLRENKDYIINSYNEGKSTSKLSKEFNCNAGSIYFFLKENEVTIRSNPKPYGYLNTRKDDIVQMYNEGLTLGQISKDIGIKVSSLAKFMKNIGLNTSRYSSHREDKLVNHKDEIIAMYLSGLTLEEIGRKFKSNSGSMWQLLNRCGVKCRSKTIYSLNHNFLNKIDNEQRSWFLGFFMADGNVSEKKNVFRISLIDKDVIEKMKALLEYTGPTREIYPSETYPNRQIQYELAITSKQVVSDLISYGCIPAKTFKVQWPNDIQDDLVKNFVRGYFEGDGCLGCFGKYRKWSIQIVGTNEFCSGLGEHLKSKLDVAYGMYKRHPNRPTNNITLTITGIDRVNKFLDYIYGEATIYMQRKYNKYLEFKANAIS